MKHQIDTAVIPVAGLGTRMGTFTEGVPKFMAPVYAGNEARPAIDYMIDECLGAGIRNLVFVTSDGGDEVLHKYLGPLSEGRHAQLAAQVARDPKKQAQLDKELARRATFANLNIMYIEQPVGPYGTAVPLALARDALRARGIEQFIVTGGDDYIWHPDGHSEWADALEEWDGQGSIIMGDAVAPKDAPRYGILQDDGQGYLRQIIEKPAPKNVPANPTRNISRYIAGPELWPHLDRELQRIPDAGQPEHYVTDVITNAIAAGARFKIHRITGAYLDSGTPATNREAGAYITAQLQKLQSLTSAAH